MPDNYAGNPLNYPATITTITADDTPSDVVLSTPLEQLADRTAYQSSAHSTLNSTFAAVRSDLNAAAVFGISGANVLNDEFTLTEIFDPGFGFQVSVGTLLIFPRNGKYWIDVQGRGTNTSTSNPLTVTLDFNIAGGASQFKARGVRWSASTTDPAMMNACGMVNVPDHNADFLQVTNLTAVGTTTLDGSGDFHPVVMLVKYLGAF